MWKKALTSILAIAAITMSLNANPRHHNKGAEAFVGGMIAGAVLTEIFDDSSVNVHLASRHCDSRSYKHYDRRNDRGSRDGWHRYDNSWKDYDYRRHDRNRHYNDYSGGRWEYQMKKVWVPGHWDYIRRDCGRKAKIWVDGYWDRRRIKVWVSYRNRGGCR